MQIICKLYIDYKDYQLIYVDKNKFVFTNVVDIDPNKIIDFGENSGNITVGGKITNSYKLKYIKYKKKYINLKKTLGI